MSDTFDTDSPPRFLIGIDLGTTNSALAFVDTADKAPAVRDLAIPQLIAPATIESRQTLPSFHYESAAGEFSAGALRLPWSEADPNFVVGALARDHGAAVPGRLVVSAKSWLSHSGVDRTAGLLPWHGAADAERLSPVQVSARYLAHLRGAWDHQFPAHPMSRQEVVLAVPASFDEVARELTIEAARLAGLVRVVLVEEPQAAFYAWIADQGEKWERHVKAGQKILVCDIGGGTSDFTLIRVRPAANGKVIFHRVAVGEHLILGGDNLDLAIAHRVEQKLGRKLEPRYWGPLLRASRVMKETLLGEDPPATATMNVFAGGSKLVGGASQVQLGREEIRTLLLDGFLPRAALGDKPMAHRSGFQEFGLPYAKDAAITRYLAAFLSAHRNAGTLPGEETDPGHDPARPDLVLFNGGLFESPVLRDRLLQVLASWFNSDGQTPEWKPHVLRNDRLDLAVSRGAAYYAMVRRGHGVRISGGLAHSYYIGVETPAIADHPAEQTPVESALADADQGAHSVRASQPLAKENPPRNVPSPQPSPLRTGAREPGNSGASAKQFPVGSALADADQGAHSVRASQPLVKENSPRNVPSPQPSPLRTEAREPENSGASAEQFPVGSALADADQGAHSVRASQPLAKEAPSQNLPSPQPFPGNSGQREPEMQAVCLLPAGVEEGQTVDLSDRTFNLLIRQPVEFPLYASSTRTTDRPGELLAVDAEQMTPLPPIRTVLQSGRKASADSVLVRLHARLTEIGTLDIWCAELKGDRTWRLQFDVRAATRADAVRHDSAGEAQGVLDEQILQSCRRQISLAFDRNHPAARPESLVKKLEETTGIARHDWPSTLLRAIWEAVLEAEPGRRVSDVHESRWLNLAGYGLRPGYGLAADDWRVGQIWKLFSAGVVHHKNESVRAEWWILWRRLAGGMTAGQQRTIAEALLADWRTWFRKSGINVKGRSPGFQFGPHESAEVWRLLGSLELLPSSLKLEIGGMILDRLDRESAANARDALLFAVGRIGARVPVYGPLNVVLEAENVEAWAGRLIAKNAKDEKAAFAIVQLCRRTDDRYRDVSNATRQAALDWLIARDATAHSQKLVRDGGALESEEQRIVFGESLPRGLRIE